MAVFAKVVELGSQNAAAEALNKGQSSINDDVQKLESLWGVTLLNGGKGVAYGVTAAGELAYPLCRLVLHTTDVTERAFRLGGHKLKGTIQPKFRS
jgi:DNA-binding transcriptional LysR family regulator